MVKLNSSQRTFNVLLVEDNEDDVLLTKRAFKDVPVSVHLHVARDGVQALEMLRRQPPFEDLALPDIILLDLNMPRMDGRQLLSALKDDETLKIIPSVVLTTSASEHDVHNAYLSHANAYLTKPIDLHEFISQTETFVRFWLNGPAVLPQTCVGQSL